jgi:hypothetical protein
MQVTWQKCNGDDHWCSLEYLSLETLGDSAGVYIIWHEGNPSRVVRVGQGKIKDRLDAHRKDDEILAYTEKGTLRVTWAKIPSSQRDGIERYLGDTLKPLVGPTFPDVDPISVNLPWK